MLYKVVSKKLSYLLSLCSLVISVDVAVRAKGNNVLLDPETAL
jgi:hypothetical protein